MAVDMGYVELARLAQSAFDGRRKVEWRINFSLWGGLGIIAHWAMKYHIPIFDSKWTANCTVGVIIFLYISALFWIGLGHREDKAWKHYYMKKAEGIASFQPIKPWIPHWTQLYWIAIYAIFTFGLILYVFKLLIKDKLCC